MPGEPGPHGGKIVTRMRRSANPGDGLGMGIRQRCRAGVGAPVLARDDRVDPCVGHAAGNDQPLLAGAGVDATVVIPFDADRAAESASDFVRTVLVDSLAAKRVVSRVMRRWKPSFQ